MAMHSLTVEPWQHEHAFLGARHEVNERRTWLVVVLTAAMMVAEVVAGSLFGSMALIADGLHMSTHAAALAIAGLAYYFARRYARHPRFSFGTGKLGELAGFASAVILAVIALLIGFESVLRIWTPVAIRFDQAIAVAVLGLAVNLLSAWLLRDDDHHDVHGHGNAHAHAHDHEHHHHSHGHEDHNLRAAYVHVLADALTSVLAIVGLLVARFEGWVWIDPAVGIVGAIVIAAWSWRLIRASGAILLDTVPDPDLAERIRDRIETGGDRLSDLHLWRVGPGHSAVIAAVVSDRPRQPEAYAERLAGIKGLSHVTIEVHRCPGHAPLSAAA
jgi:cation diffusion facilitator family transporter